jgi:hypothetical protein
MTWGNNIFPLLEVFSSPGSPTGQFNYSPVPGPGNLVASNTESATDPYGNITLPGGPAVYDNSSGRAMIVTSNSLQEYTGSLSAGWTLSTAFFAALGGEQWQEVSSDTGNYDTARRTLRTATDKTFSSTSNAVITGLSCPVAAGTYNVDGVITWTQGPAAAAQNFRLDGPAASAVSIPYFHALTASGVSNGIGRYTALGSNVASPGFAIGSVVFLYLKGMITFTAAGTLDVSAGCGVSGADTFVVNALSYLNVMPVTS